MSKPSIFIVYASEDESYRNKLEDHLGVLQRSGYISAFKRLLAGDNITKTLEKNLQEADIIMPLISIDFLNSAIAQSVTLEDFVEQQKKIIPILIRSCLWEESLFGKLRALPSKDPVKNWRDIDEAFTYIATELRNIIKSNNGEDISPEEYKSLLSEIRKEKQELRKKYNIITVLLLVAKFSIISSLSYWVVPFISPSFSTNSLIPPLTAFFLSLGVLYLWHLKKYHFEELKVRFKKISLHSLILSLFGLLIYTLLFFNFTVKYYPEENPLEYIREVKGVYLNNAAKAYLASSGNSLTDEKLLKKAENNPRKLWEYVGLVETLFVFSIIMLIMGIGTAIFTQIENQENKRIDDGYNRIMERDSS